MSVEKLVARNHIFNGVSEFVNFKVKSYLFALFQLPKIRNKVNSNPASSWTNTGSRKNFVRRE